MENRGIYKVYREERTKGLTYRQIADKYNTSYQNIAHACGRYQPSQFQYYRTTACIYPNFRKWLNATKLSRAELLRKMSAAGCGTSQAKLNYILRGERQPSKARIDFFIKLTGLTYENLFYEEKETTNDN